MDVGGLKLARTLLRAGQIDFSRSDLEVSVSSLQFSSQSREVLVSYQKDRIYRFPCGQEHEGNAEPIPTQTFCGAINEHTFLKRAVYFGPQEEYVVCGGDGGSLFVFASQSGELVNTFSRADSGGVVNGVVPNPAMQCCLVSYGLDSDAKLWTVGDREEDEGEVGNEISRGSAPHQAKIFHVLIQARDTVLDTRRRQYFEDDPYQTMLSYGVRLARMLEQQQPQRGPSRSLVLAARDSGKSESLATSRGRFEYCLQAMEKLRTRGNELFRAFQFQEALDLFAVAVQYALGACALFAMTVSSNDPRVAKMGLHAVDDEDDDDEEEEEEDGDLKVNRKTFDEIWGLLEIASTNAAECALKLVPTTQTAAHHFAGEALLFSDQALLANPQSLKARYRRYRALTYLGKRAEAGLEMDRIKALPNGATWIKKLKI
ncbi:hypothetical protein BASA81_008669 [Batrachochytrium salamandrivorans]|nr:hypothetical protein BASA81_008669 [Batrachochytrium salamandrivorans]